MLGKAELVRELKKFPLLYSLNARWKAASVKAQYRKCVKHYAGLPLKGTAQELLEARAGKRLEKFRGLTRKPRIFLLGTDEFQDRSGMLQALERAGDVRFYTRPDGSYGQNHPGTAEERTDLNSARLLEHLRNLKENGWVPDLLIAQTWANFISPAALAQARDLTGALIINITMDDRHQYFGARFRGGWAGSFDLIPSIDLTLSAAPECVDWYLKEGAAAIFFPEASDPELFHPMPDLSKIHDVSFVGAAYGVRGRIVRELEHAGIHVAAYGSGWPSGRISVEGMRKLFAQSRIILGVGTIGHCEDFYSLKLRDFDAPMSGSFYLTHANPDLSRVFRIGEEVEVYRTPAECVQKVRYYLANEKIREAAARRAYERVRNEHSWDRRFQDLFLWLKSPFGNS